MSVSEISGDKMDAIPAIITNRVHDVPLRTDQNWRTCKVIKYTSRNRATATCTALMGSKLALIYTNRTDPSSMGIIDLC